MNKPQPIIGVLIPTRGDRIAFMDQCMKMLKNQTLQPDHIYVVDTPPLSNDIDVTYRYRIGCEHLFRRKKCDVVLFTEDDDYYSPHYIFTMILEWKKAGRPEIFGIGFTIYYHIFQQMYVTIPHQHRASAMSTMVTRSILGINWPKDNNPYLDVDMWAQIPGRTFIPRTPLCIGIKHGIGLVGGGAHNGDNKHYNMKDFGGVWLRGTVGDEAYGFYEQLQKSALV